MVLILESRSHLDLGDLPNLLAAELGVMTVRLERAIRSLDGVARVHVNRWGDGSAHLHMWFLARPYGRLQLRGTFLSLWDSILPPISEDKWRENLALVAAWLAEFGGRPLAEPPRIQWQAPSSLTTQSAPVVATKAPQGGSLLDAIGETAEPPAAEASDLGVWPGPTGTATEGPDADAPDPGVRPASTGTATEGPETEVRSASTEAASAAAAVPSPRPSPEGQRGELESALPGASQPESLVGAAAAAASADGESESATARRTADSPTRNATAEADAAGVEAPPAGSAGEVTGPTDRPSTA
ncbi:hypothetical protein QQG74_31540 [Micromonospora sp. FIMYZ51]|uniref:hypothetical protein n=1 Tax=Micromonospora sp. FIMYZ51 TaxID=3051832 RepID=UPI00311E8AC1